MGNVHLDTRFLLVFTDVYHTLLERKDQISFSCKIVSEYLLWIYLCISSYAYVCICLYMCMPLILVSADSSSTQLTIFHWSWNIVIEI